MKASSSFLSRTQAGLLAFVLWAAPAVAMAQNNVASQQNTASQSGASAPIDVTPSTNGHGDGMYIPLTKGRPFKVRFNVETAKPLPDGSTVKQKYYVMAARDSAGYEYREVRDFVPADSDREPALVSTMVYDPKNSRATMCLPSRHTCQRRSFDPTLQPAGQPGIGTTDDGQATIQRESLGRKQMDGIEVEGTREMRTLRADGSGSSKPLVTMSEMWYSPQLQFYLLVTVTDPFGATRKVEAADLKLGEPGEEWFAIPDGYRILVQRTMAPQMRAVPSLEQIVRQHVTGISEEQLTVELQPVDAAVLNYAKIHAAGAPNDPANKPLFNVNDAESGDIGNSRLVSNLRMRLSAEVQSMQMNEQRMNQTQMEDATARMNTAYGGVIESPCINKPAPGDPPTMPSSAAALVAEQKAWMQVYATWTEFLKGLFPNSSGGFGFMLASERAGELQRMENVERNRGCIPEEKMEASVERLVSGRTPEQLSATLKPVDTAMNAYIRAHVVDEPNDNEANFARMVESRLSADLQQQERGRPPTHDQFEESELHLNQAFRAVIESPCIDRHIPGDPPNAPASGDKLKAEETAWLAMRDAWVKFVASLYPNSGASGFGYSMTEQRAMELRQIQNIERNRGCRNDDGN
jgi:uncharacterized protein YecT (DUF1311 family)